MRRCILYLLFMSPLTMCKSPPSAPEPPFVSIEKGPAEGDTIFTSVVTFEWKGLPEVVEFAYRFNKVEAIDTTKFCEWTTERSATFNYLDEISYRFEIKARNPETGEESEPIGRTFTVDAIDGPSLLIFPMLNIVNIGKEFDVQVVAEEVQNVGIAKVVMQFDPLKLNVVEIEKGEFLGVTQVLLKEWDNDKGKLEFNIGAVNCSTGVSGTGVLATVKFFAEEKGTTDVKILKDSCAFRTIENQEIPVRTGRKGTIIIK